MRSPLGTGGQGDRGTGGQGDRGTGRAKMWYRLLASSTFPRYNLMRLSRSALVTTDTELIAMAAPANIGDRSSPKAG